MMKVIYFYIQIGELTLFIYLSNEFDGYCWIIATTGTIIFIITNNLYLSFIKMYYIYNYVKKSINNILRVAY